MTCRSHLRAYPAEMGIRRTLTVLRCTACYITATPCLSFRYTQGFLLNAYPRLVAGSDVTDRPSCVFAVIALACPRKICGSNIPSVFQHLFDRAKPEHDQNDRVSYKEN